MRLVALASLGLVLSSCSLYFPGDDDDCPYGGGTNGGSAAVPAVGQRNPESGQCEYLGGGGGGGGSCGDPCQPCPAGEGDSSGAAQYIPTWGFCESQCTGLDEASCLGASGCRGVYREQATACDRPDCGTGLAFLECWSTDQTGPLQGGGCDGLDATTCSLHDDCIAVHQTQCPGDTMCSPAGFLACGAEPIGCYGDESCPEGTRCNAAEVCGLPPGCENGACDAACYGVCVPVEPPPACAELLDEAACIERIDCTPYYRGEDCTCAGDACTCTWIFESCS